MLSLMLIIIKKNRYKQNFFFTIVNCNLNIMNDKSDNNYNLISTRCYNYKKVYPFIIQVFLEYKVDLYSQNINKSNLLCKIE